MKKFYKNEKDGWVFGVCQGLGEHFGIDPMFFRLLVLFVPALHLPYFIVAICAPEKPEEEQC